MCGRLNLCTICRNLSQIFTQDIVLQQLHKLLLYHILNVLYKHPHSVAGRNIVNNAFNLCVGNSVLEVQFILALFGGNLLWKLSSVTARRANLTERKSLLQSAILIGVLLHNVFIRISYQRKYALVRGVRLTDKRNIKDMLENGTVMNGKMIESPKSFQTACTITTEWSARPLSMLPWRAYRRSASLRRR